jgi:hypothetical protein
MNKKEFIQSQFDTCIEAGLITSVHFYAGMALGRAIETGEYGELEPFIQQCRWDAIDRIKKTQQETSNEL